MSWPTDCTCRRQPEMDTPVLNRALLTGLVTIAAGAESKMCFKLSEKHIALRSLQLYDIGD